MKKFESTAKYKEVTPVAKELGIKFVGVKTEVLIELVNAKIEEMEAAKAPKAPRKQKASKTLADYGLFEGQVVTITGFDVKGKTILAGREVQITRPSRAKGYIKGRLINSETGEAQKTEIAITMDIIKVGSHLPSLFMVGA